MMNWLHFSQNQKFIFFSIELPYQRGFDIDAIVASMMVVDEVAQSAIADTSADTSPTFV